MTLYNINAGFDISVSPYNGNCITIFNKSNILSRDRDVKLKKALNRYNSELDSWNSRRDSVQSIIDSLDPEQHKARLSRLRNRLNLINKLIAKITTTIFNINDQLNNLNFKVADTIGLSNSTANEYRYNVHNYTNFQEITFAPNYPVRFYS